MNNNPLSYISNHFNARPGLRKEGMRLGEPIVCRNCLNKSHENYLSVSSIYPNNSVRLNYFLATSEFFSETEAFDFDKALKLRPYCGIIGVDISSVDKYLKSQDIYVCTLFYTTQGIYIRKIQPRNWLFLYASVEKQQLLKRTFVANIVLIIYKGFSSINLSFIGMMSIKTVVLDVEGFRHRKENFFVKELGFCTEDYLDCVSFLPPSYSELTTQ